MKKLNAAALEPHGYVLPEEGREKLAHLRDQLLLMSSFVFASTSEEEDQPLEVFRSRLGQLLEDFGLRVDEVLELMTWGGERVPVVVERH